MKRKKLKGGAFIELVIGITAFLTGGIGLLILDAITCDFNVIFSSGCGSSGYSGGTASDPTGQICTSAPNACGMTNNGTLVLANLEGVSGDLLVCNADVPPNSLCAPPEIAADDFYADPAIIGINMSSTLHWDLSGPDTVTCTISGTNGFSYSGGESGSVSTGNLAATATFTLTCRDGAGPEGSSSVRVVVDPRYKEI